MAQLTSVFMPFIAEPANQARRTAEIVRSVLALDDTRELIDHLRAVDTRAGLIEVLDAYVATRAGSVKRARFGRSLDVVGTLAGFFTEGAEGEGFTLVGSGANGGLLARSSDIDIVPDPAWTAGLKVELPGPRSLAKEDLIGDGMPARFGRLQRAIGYRLSLVDDRKIATGPSTFDGIPRRYGDVQPISFRLRRGRIRMMIYDVGVNDVHVFDVTKLVPVRPVR